MMAGSCSHSREASSHLKSWCREAEQHEDSVWSSASESRSEAGSDNTTSVDSALRDLPTVRANNDEGENEIQKLILAAEALVLERSRLKLSSHMPATTASPEDLVARVQATTTYPGPGNRTHHGVEWNNHREVLSDTKSGTGNSGYFTDSEGVAQTPNLTSTISGEISVNLDIFERRDQCSLMSRESVSSTACDSLLSNVLDSPQNGNRHLLLKESVTSGENLINVPRLPLEHTGHSNTERAAVAPEEKTAFNKVEKEACNSSIKSSAGGTCGPLKELHTVDSEGGQSTSPPHLGSPSQPASAVVHDEGSSLLHLALASTSSLKRLTRLLRQVTSLHLGADTPRLGQSVLQELEQHEAQHDQLETQLTSAAAQLQVAVAHVHRLEGQEKEHQQESEATHHTSSALLQQVETSLESCGLHHLMAVTSPRRRGSARMLEDVGSAVALLTGELTRRTQRLDGVEEEVRSAREELQRLRETQAQQDSRARLCEAEVRQVREQSSAELASLRQCLAQAEHNLQEAQHENLRVSEGSKRQVAEGGATLAALQQRLCEAQRSAESRIDELEQTLHHSNGERQSLEGSVKELKDQLTLRTRQMHLVEEENSLLIEGLRSTLKQQQTEGEQLRHQLDSATTEKTCLTHTVDELKLQLAAMEEKHQEVQEEAVELRRRITGLLEEHTDTEKALQEKIDSNSSARCELEAQLRAQELTILQLRTELEMEKVQTRALKEETTALEKKAKDLQERLWSHTRRRHNSSDSTDSTKQHGGSVTPCWSKESSSECGSYASVLPPGTTLPHTSPMHQVKRDFESSLAREEQLQLMLHEKDEALHHLQHSFSTHINTKNQELETLTNKLVTLEEQLVSLVQGLETSAAIGDITTEVGQLLQERTQHLDSLQQSSHWLQGELSSLALENQTLSTELVMAKRSERDSVSEAQMSLRQSRQEAREEKLAAARLQEKCSRLQAQLDLAQHTLTQERQERRMSALVTGVKHQEFGTLLESATAALNHHQA